MKFTHSSCVASEPAEDSHPISKASTPAPVEEQVETVIPDVQSAREFELPPIYYSGSGSNDSDIQASMSRPNSTEEPLSSAEPTHESSGKSSPDQALGNEHDGSSNDIISVQVLEAALQEATEEGEAPSDDGK